MNIALLSGAYKNAGDFLIVQRCKELLLNTCGTNSTIQEYKRNLELDEFIGSINQNDVIVLAGGPAYVKDMYPNKIVLCSNLKELKPPIFPMALGWWGKNDLPHTVFEYSYSEKTRELLSKIENSGFSFGCRDYLTERVLKNNGIENTIMTGCAAWYDLQYLDTCGIRNNESIRKIYVSDPASSRYFSQFLELCIFLQKRFPEAIITAVFHRGLYEDRYTSEDQAKKIKKILCELKNLGIAVKDISYGYEGLHCYDDCDLQIGYRVHAHIYNLSQRRRSILIEEDSRGAGVNRALGLPRLLAYNVERQINNKYIKKVNQYFHFINTNSEYFLSDVEQCLSILEENHFIEIKWAFERMQYYYTRMVKHLEEVKSI